MILGSHSETMRQQKNRARAIVREITGKGMSTDVHLDLGKKVSTPQHLMMEELSLQNNIGSLMYQKRQKRVQRFTLEYPENTKPAGKRTTSQIASAAGGSAESSRTHLVDGYADGTPGKENYRTEVYIPPSGTEGPPTLPKKSGKVFQMKSQNPSAIAPGYSGPLVEVPREKFNITAIPKSYCSPWYEERDYQENSLTADLPEPLEPQNCLDLDYRCFNRAAIPFGGCAPSERMMALPLFEEAPPQPEMPGSLELMCKRRSFNRAPRGWRMQYIPESDDL
ncbi:myozenin-3 [Ambystoma mexicanum]|uniref:myozenin-3 n=1 Tax=Ambystoma mexicanum TaxID=8296 RepID=UPI0037E90C76